MNLYKELTEVLNNHGKTLDDIVWVGNYLTTVPVDWFLDEIKKFEYDSGYGCAEVRESLMIVGEDWWLERHEYDGSEWFEFKHLPKRPEKHSLENIWDNQQSWEEV